MKPETLPVVYRRFKEGDVIALFPTIDESRGMIGSYQHIGQHGAASPLLTRGTKPASLTEPDVSELHAELTDIYTTRPTARPDVYGPPVRLIVRKRMRRA